MMAREIGTGPVVSVALAADTAGQKIEPVAAGVYAGTVVEGTPIDVAAVEGDIAEFVPEDELAAVEFENVEDVFAAGIVVVVDLELEPVTELELVGEPVGRPGSGLAGRAVAEPVYRFAAEPAGEVVAGPVDEIAAGFVAASVVHTNLG